jgi:PAS domain-containing protein
MISDRPAGTHDAVSRLDALFDEAPVAFQVFGPDGRCLHCNAAFRELFGPEPPLEYDVPDGDIAARHGHRELIRRAFAGEVIGVPPVWYDRREIEEVEAQESRRIAVEAVAVPLVDADGIVRHVAIMFIDRTAELDRREQTGTRLRTIPGSP